ncbi:DUF1800 domain-containing protein [Planctomycetota bacterium]|nr:DUF1800 domain-containing protein [Planctomycetota bacterium]
MFNQIRYYLCTFVALLTATTLHADLTIGQLSQQDQINYHILSRMTFGPTPQALSSIQKLGAEQWIKNQLNPSQISTANIDTRCKIDFPSLYMPLTDAIRTYNPPYTKASNSPKDQKRRNRLRSEIQSELRNFVIFRAANSERQFEEVILNFWRNHFAIDQTKDNVAFYAPDFENTLRTHAFGRFDQLLLATAKHPAMLFYLDNHISQKPLSPREEKQVAAAERRNAPKAKSLRALERQRGLNENYARELMELHTLGVDNGYTQQDVTDLARALTGWTAAWSTKRAQADPKAVYNFHFNTKVHDSKPKYVLGSRLTGSTRVTEGSNIILKLAHHPNTARFISFKLCQYLVDDQPPEGLVTEIASVFTQSKGNLKKVYKAILFSDDFLRADHYRSKFRTPFEFTIASLRATNASISRYDSLIYAMNSMGQNLYRCPDPTGYYDFAEAWLDPGVMIYRWQFAENLANNRIKGVRTSPIKPNQLANYIDTQTATQILMLKLKPDLSSANYTALILGSPDFQSQ